MQPHIRLATTDDAAAVLAVYAPYVRDTAISFEYDVPEEAEMRRRMENVLQVYPWLVAEQDGDILGYAYASRFHPRAAFQWTVETSIYLAPQVHRQGLGRTLYTRLLDTLTRQGLVKAIAAITLPNPRSTAFHEALGFAPARAHMEVGFKHGQWHGVGYWEYALRPTPTSPHPPRTVHEVWGCNTRPPADTLAP